MNFPDTPFYHLLYWLVNTAGVGSLVVLAIGLISIGAYLLTLRWIARGANLPELEDYPYPTPALHAHEEQADR